MEQGKEIVYITELDNRLDRMEGLPHSRRRDVIEMHATTKDLRGV